VSDRNERTGNIEWSGWEQGAGHDVNRLMEKGARLEGIHHVNSGSSVPGSRLAIEGARSRAGAE
jgi:hypothetical protein